MGQKHSSNVFTSETHPLQVDFIPSEYLPTNSRLGLCMCPGRNKKCWRRDLTQDLDRIKQCQTQTLVTLVTEHELHKMGIASYLEVVQSDPYQLQSFHFPITDKSLPRDREEFCNLIDFIVKELVAQRTVVVHCNGGKGRAATVCTAVLVALRMHKISTCERYLEKVGDAIEVVRKTRGGGTLKNPLQIIWLKTKYVSHYGRFHMDKQFEKASLSIAQVEIMEE